MNQEIEIQVVLKNPEQVEEKLKPFFVKEKKQKDEYFVPKHEDFFALERPIKYLRVRHEEGNDQLCYHFLHFDKDITDPEALLTTDEYETKVEDPKMMSTILKKLDMTNTVTVTKHRKIYDFSGFENSKFSKHRKTFDYKNFEIVIDHIEELGYFMEIEAKKLLGSVEETKKKCYEILEEIGAEWAKPSIGGYPRMILKKNEGK